MGSTPKKLYVGQPADVIETLYTSPTSTKTIVTHIILSNTTTSDASIDFHLVPSGGVADATNNVVPSQVIKAGESTTISLNAILEAGDTIQAKQSLLNTITAYINGTEIV